ncbi:hypothetical protein [Dechloromonas hortensis]|uniref:hypothetical protein n=1 Tax=Dechloromonas hortensis TaxID=337779 RepID=UPI001291A212|nr:hypothetical protein [Dechloromonas hortensis]
MFDLIPALALALVASSAPAAAQADEYGVYAESITLAAATHDDFATAFVAFATDEQPTLAAPSYSFIP